MITQLEFEENVGKFPNFEDLRSKIADSVPNLLSKGFEIEAYVLILSTWNFANFRYILKKFNTNKFKNTLANINPVFERLKVYDFKTADFDKLESDITFIYEHLKEHVQQTGAVKLMHFKVPTLFVMWDTGIRKKYKISNKATASDYVNFLKLMQKEFSHIKWSNQKISFARAIDIYNFIITQEKSRKTI